MKENKKEMIKKNMDFARKEKFIYEKVLVLNFSGMENTVLF